MLQEFTSTGSVVHRDILLLSLIRKLESVIEEAKSKNGQRKSEKKRYGTKYRREQEEDNLAAEELQIANLTLQSGNYEEVIEGGSSAGGGDQASNSQ